MKKIDEKNKKINKIKPDGKNNKKKEIRQLFK
jgi:hypothetical protein